MELSCPHWVVRLNCDSHVCVVNCSRYKGGKVSRVRFSSPRGDVQPLASAPELVSSSFSSSRFATSRYRETSPLPPITSHWGARLGSENSRNSDQSIPAMFLLKGYLYKQKFDALQRRKITTPPNTSLHPTRTSIAFLAYHLDP